MKFKLERDGGWIEFARLGRVVFLRNAEGAETEQGFFDDDAAEAGLHVMLDARLAEGWAESVETITARDELRREQANRAARQASNDALQAASDPRAALRVLAGPCFADGREDFEVVLSRVARIEGASEGGFRVVLEGGGAIEWSCDLDAPLTGLWLYPDAQALELNSHALYFGDDASPPEPVDGLEEAAWFLEELPDDRYWFTTPGAPGEARAWEFDGGLHEREHPARSPTRVLAAKLREKLSDAR